jgi:hypothetical protein
MSDGIFEFKDNQEVLEAVHALATRGAGPNEAAKHLVKEARRCGCACMCASAGRFNHIAVRLRSLSVPRTLPVALIVFFSQKHFWGARP